MASRKSKWVISEDKHGFTLTRGGRQLYQGLSSKQEALRRLKNHHRPGETVVMEEDDGFQRNITDQLRRGGIIS